MLHMMGPMMIGMGIASMFGGWGSQMGGCCNNMLGGPAQGCHGHGGRKTMMGALLGTLVGGALSMGNPLGALLGMGVGAAIGSQFGGHNQGGCCNHGHPHHGGCPSYPPHNGGCFGGPSYGGYGYPSPPFNPGPPGWCGPGHGGGPRVVHHHHHHYHHGGPGHRHGHGHHCQPHRHCHGRGGGHLEQCGKGKPIKYTTRGGYQVEVNGHTIKITDPNGKNTLKHWGDPHENLNGKHIKDWEGKDRTVVLGDGTKITMNADGPHGVTQHTSIYDGNRNIQIQNKGNVIEHQSWNPWDTAMREARQNDGETSVFRNSRNGGALYYNIYNEDRNFCISRNYRALARATNPFNPSAVRDLYDDPRLSKT